ncbi:MAG TPA: hypothetical protein VJ201_02460 [Candidatus Babeliales bacterium]|nr:hypothetical protein [Candidatus Babeliales bacterium]HLC07631.1 hypothetical protein [Candidatus Babeliales bacterium]
MARLRPAKAINVLAFEEKTRLTNFFMLLVEIDLRSPKTIKTKRRTKAKTKHRPIEKDPCYIKCPAMSDSSRIAQRDFFLQALNYY